jgi:hypothetical protein
MEVVLGASVVVGVGLGVVEVGDEVVGTELEDCGLDDEREDEVTAEVERVAVVDEDAVRLVEEDAVLDDERPMVALAPEFGVDRELPEVLSDDPVPTPTDT